MRVGPWAAAPAGSKPPPTNWPIDALARVTIHIADSVAPGNLKGRSSRSQVGIDEATERCLQKPQDAGNRVLSRDSWPAGPPGTTSPANEPLPRGISPGILPDGPTCVLEGVAGWARA